MNIKIGDYISFDNEYVLYKVLDIHYYEETGAGYVKYYDFDMGDPVWERFEYISAVYTANKKE